MKNGGKNKSVAFIFWSVYIYIDDINKSYTVPSTETFCLDRIRIHRLLLLKLVLSKKGEQFHSAVMKQNGYVRYNPFFYKQQYI